MNLKMKYMRSCFNKFVLCFEPRNCSVLNSQLLEEIILLLTLLNYHRVNPRKGASIKKNNSGIFVISLLKKWTFWRPFYHNKIQIYSHRTATMKNLAFLRLQEQWKLSESPQGQTSVMMFGGRLYIAYWNLI